MLLFVHAAALDLCAFDADEMTLLVLKFVAPPLLASDDSVYLCEAVVVESVDAADEEAIEADIEADVVPDEVELWLVLPEPLLPLWVLFASALCV